MICGRFAVVSHCSPGGSAGRAGGVRSRGQGKRAARRRISLDPSCRSQPRHRHDARAREVGDMIDALERLPRLLGRRDRHHRHQHGGCGKNCQRKAATCAKRIEAPDHPEQGNREDDRHDQLHPQPRKDREQERERVAIDQQEIEECQRQLQNIELEARQRDQQRHEAQRKRRGHAGPRQHEQEKAIDEDPRQQRQRDRKGSVFRGQQDDSTRQDAMRRPRQRRHRTGRRAMPDRRSGLFRVRRRLEFSPPAARGF